MVWSVWSNPRLGDEAFFSIAGHSSGWNECSQRSHWPGALWLSWQPWLNQTILRFQVCGNRQRSEETGINQSKGVGEKILRYMTYPSKSITLSLKHTRIMPGTKTHSEWIPLIFVALFWVSDVLTYFCSTAIRCQDREGRGGRKGGEWLFRGREVCLP